MLFSFAVFLKLEGAREIELIVSLACKGCPFYEIWTFHLGLLDDLG
jgi:hypothetical protein